MALLAKLPVIEPSLQEPLKVMAQGPEFPVDLFWNAFKREATSKSSSFVGVCEQLEWCRDAEASARERTHESNEDQQESSVSDQQ